MEFKYTRNWWYTEADLETRITLEPGNIAPRIQRYVDTSTNLLTQHNFFGDQYAGRLNKKEYKELLMNILTDFISYMKYDAMEQAKIQGCKEDESYGLTGTLKDWLEEGNHYLIEVWEVISPDIEEYQTLLVKYEDEEHEDVLHTIVMDFIDYLYWLFRK